MRTAFITQLIEEARKNERIFLLIGDLGYGVVEPFANEFPDRFLNTGIAEQNMMGVAAGLALNGYIVYCYSLANFPTLRCLEQIRNDISYYNANVRIVSVGAGFAYGSLGMSHYATEDIAVMRCLPNMTVCTPSDPNETKAITALSAQHEGPMYLRLGKAGEKYITEKLLTDYHLGDILCYENHNSETAIICAGNIAITTMQLLKTKDAKFDFYTLPTVKPINKQNLIDISKSHKKIIIVEEHQKVGGIGASIVEIISDSFANSELDYFPTIHRFGLDDIYPSIVGNQTHLQSKYILNNLESFINSNSKLS